MPDVRDEETDVTGLGQDRDDAAAVVLEVVVVGPVHGRRLTRRVAAGNHPGGAGLDRTVLQIEMRGDGEHGIGDPGVPGDPGVAGDVRSTVDVPEASEVLVVTGLLPPRGVGDDMTVLPQQWLDHLEDPPVGHGALDQAAPVQHLVPERSGLLGGVAPVVGRVLVEDPFDLGTELGHLGCVEDAAEHRVSIRLELLHRGGGPAGTERQVAKGGPSEHSQILPSMGPGDNAGPAVRGGAGIPGAKCASVMSVVQRTTLVVCEGDETGQELLEQALRVLESSALGISLEIQRFDLSLGNRRRTRNGVVDGAAAAMVEAGLGLKAATITPPGADDVGSPNRILREGVGGSVIVRTGRRISGVTPLAPVVYPIVVVRMAVGDAYGAAEERLGVPGDVDEQAVRTERIDRGICRAVAEYSFRTASDMDACVYGGPKWTVSALYEGMLKEEMDEAAARHPDIRYRPTLIDAAYAGLLTEAGDQALVIPALNRDGDCLSDLVIAMFGSIAGAESVLLALDDDLHPTVAMAEAPHGTAPSLAGKDVANPMAMLLACAAVLDHTAERADPSVADAARAIREATLGAAADGVRTFDLGGDASTTEVVDDVLARLAGGTGRS